MKKSDSIEHGIQALSQVAVIEQRGNLRGDEVVFYHLMDGAPEDADRAAFRPLDLAVDYFRQQDRRYVVLRERRQSGSGAITRTHILLFVATVLTTLAAGALLDGQKVFQQPWTLIQGWPFSLTLMAILGFHEYGHYHYARRHNVDVSLPYFIPVPPPLTFIGTFGAFIKMKGPIPGRRALLEIGAAGPIAGFVLSVLAIMIGNSLIPDQQAVFDHIEKVHGAMGLDALSGQGLQLTLGRSVLFFLLSSASDIVIPMDEIYHFPLIFAGWIGVLVTMLNLLPVAQLDGGHVAYALLGDRHQLVGRLVLVALIPMGLRLSLNWLFWGFLILVLMRTVKHPPIPDVNRPLTAAELRIGVACLIIFILCFIPVPFRMA